MSVCRSCGAPIRWALTASSGRRIPLDYDPHPDGNISLAADTSGLEILAVVDGLPLGDRPRYLSHFVTCPQAEGWRRK